jgi:fluoride ion exporter CrcB/FEX
MLGEVFRSLIAHTSFDTCVSNPFPVPRISTLSINLLFSFGVGFFISFSSLVVRG